MVVNRHWWALALMLFWSGLLAAQGVRVRSYLQEERISLSELLQVNLEVSSDGRLNLQTPAAPRIPNFNYRSMRNSSSSQTSIVNGNVSVEYTLTYSYFFNPQKTGRFTIPSFQLRIGNRNFSTNALNVEVVAGSPKPNRQFNVDPYIDPYGTDYFGRNRSAGDSEILCLPQSQSVFAGEPAVVSYYLYTSQMVESFSTQAERDYEGYGKSTFEQPTNLKYETVPYRDSRYQRALIKRLVLYPQVPGRLQAPTLSGVVQFSGVYSFLNKSLDSRPAWLEVKPLPAGKPSAYTGAVGSFSVSESYSESKITLGAALVCTVKITGRGNFSQFTAPSFPALKGFQVSEPSLQDKLATPIEGTRFIYYTILPQSTGDYRIPGVRFSWFDSESGRYREYAGPEKEISVKPANVLSYFSGLLQGGKPKTLNPLLLRAGYPNYRNYSSSFWFWLVIAACLLAVAVNGRLAYERRQIRLDPALFAQKTATRVLGKYLRKAESAAQNMSGDFYPLAESGLLTYLAKKFGVSRGLPVPELLEKLRDQGLDPDLIQQTGDFLLLCQTARYSPGGAEALRIMDALSKLRLVVQSFSRLRRNAAGGAAFQSDSKGNKRNVAFPGNSNGSEGGSK